MTAFEFAIARCLSQLLDASDQRKLTSKEAVLLVVVAQRAETYDVAVAQAGGQQ